MDEQTLKKIEEQSKVAPLSPVKDMTDFRDTWRVFRIMAELIEGYNFLVDLKKEVTIFGSARFSEHHAYYKVARNLGKLLGKNGFITITGGGPGIMEAANRGAFEAGGESIGLNIQLPLEQRTNPYVKKSAGFNYFFTRKVMLTSPANAFVFFPGGFGTLDEFFEVVDLIDLNMLTPAPIVLVGKKFWQPILDFIRGQCVPVGSVREEQVSLWHLVDTADEAFAHMKDVGDVMEICDLSPNNFHCKGNIDWKIFQVMAELVEGFDFVTGMNHAVTVLGTKSITMESPYFAAAHALGQQLAQHGYSVVTGGKFGIAEAANKGAFEAGGTSIGIGMRVGRVGADVNPYLSKSILFQFPFTRKLIMGAPTKAFVFFPGGLGTMHQLFEVLTLMQTKKMERLPVVLYDAVFWEPLQDFIHEVLIKKLKTIAPGDGDLFRIVDDVSEIITLVETSHSAGHWESLAMPRFSNGAPLPRPASV